MSRPAASYNAFVETTSRQSTWSGNTLYAASYTRDDLGRVATKTETVQGVTTTWAYGYDARGSLETVHTNGTLTATWGYDPNGNRVSQVTPAGTTVGFVDHQDRLISWGAASFSYDDHGDLTTRTDSTGVTSYDYDLFGNLRRVDLPVFSCACEHHQNSAGPHNEMQPPQHSRRQNCKTVKPGTATRHRTRHRR